MMGLIFQYSLTNHKNESVVSISLVRFLGEDKTAQYGKATLFCYYIHWSADCFRKICTVRFKIHWSADHF